MAKQEKILSLDLLLEELDRIVLRLNEEGAGLFKAGKYDLARAIGEFGSVLVIGGGVLRAFFGFDCLYR